MLMAWFDDAALAGAAGPRGGSPVGMLAELPMLERGAIRYLRLWCEGTQGQMLVVHDLALAFGPVRAQVELDRLDALMRLVLAEGRRPLMRHGRDCACFGGDESAFAGLISAAVVGERGDAMVFALALIAPDLAFAAVLAAEGFGLAILGLARVMTGPADPLHPDATRH